MSGAVNAFRIRRRTNLVLSELRVCHIRQQLLNPSASEENNSAESSSIDNAKTFRAGLRDDHQGNSRRSDPARDFARIEDKPRRRPGRNRPDS